MAEWRLDGKPRTSRRYTTYTNCPLPTPEDRLLFILVYLKTYSLQVVHGRLFGMVQGKANQWIHALLPALRATVRTLGDAPARSIAELAHRLNLLDADVAAALSAHTKVEGFEPAGAADQAAASSPLLPRTVSNVRSSDPQTRLNRRTILAARKNAIRSRTCC
jgi:hypothetical protein